MLQQKGTTFFSNTNIWKHAKVYYRIQNKQKVVFNMVARIKVWVNPNESKSKIFNQSDIYWSMRCMRSKKNNTTFPFGFQFQRFSPTFEEIACHDLLWCIECNKREYYQVEEPLRKWSKKEIHAKCIQRTEEDKVFQNNIKMSVKDFVVPFYVPMPAIEKQVTSRSIHLHNWMKQICQFCSCFCFCKE